MGAPFKKELLVVVEASPIAVSPSTELSSSLFRR